MKATFRPTPLPSLRKLYSRSPSHRVQSATVRTSPALPNCSRAAATRSRWGLPAGPGTTASAGNCPATSSPTS
mgnify:CR=1 FL=1